MSSNQCIFKGMYDNVFKSDVFYTNVACDRSVALPSDSVYCKKNHDNVTVTTRVFYDSNCQKENVKALFSRGNKRCILKNGRQVKTHAPQIHKTSCAPNSRDSGYGLTVLSQHLMLVMSMILFTKLSTRLCQVNCQVNLFSSSTTTGLPG